MHPFPVWIKHALEGLSFTETRPDWRVKTIFKRTCLDKVLPRFGGPSAMKDAKTAKRPHFVHFGQIPL